MSKDPHPHWMFRARLAHERLTDNKNEDQNDQNI